MIETAPKYNPVVDRGPVSQLGYVDINNAFRNGAIPSDITADDTKYNGIEEPDSIMGKPSDEFEAAQYAHTRNHYVAPEPQKPAEE